MGSAGSKSERAPKFLDFPKRLTGYSSQPGRPHTEVLSPDHPSGVKLSWLVTNVHASLNLDPDAPVSRVVDEFVLPPSVITGSANSSDAYGPATHIVLVHPSTPWSAFIKAVLNHVRLDPKRALLAGEAPLSPRSPLLAFGSSPSHHHSNAGHNPVDPESWLNDGLGGPDSAYQLTYLHIDFTAWGSASSPGSTCPAEHPLSRMAQPAALLVLDPAGAIFKDPKAVRALGEAIAILGQAPRCKDPVHCPAADDPQATAVAADCGHRLQLASCLAGSDWTRVAEAFGRLAGVLPNEAAVVRAVVDGVLEAARLRYRLYCPLLNLNFSRASYTAEMDCSGLSPAEENLLPGQIDTGRKPERDDGPGSQSAINKFTRSVGALAARPTAPIVPSTSAETITMARKSHSMTEAANGVSTSARHIMLSAPSASAAAAAAGAASGGGAGGPAAGGSASSPDGALLSNAVGGTAGANSRITGIPNSVSSRAWGGGGSGGVPLAVGGGGLVAMGYYDAALMGSVGSSIQSDSLSSFAVEAARRYAALLEGTGLWAAAQVVLESCLDAAGDRWGNRSSRMAALRSQLGRLQQLQGLHKAAEFTWRQALEALGCSQGPGSPAALLGQVALAGVMASLREPDAETLLRGALASLDTLCGPTAPETLVAREALAGFLLQSSRWVEAEVVYQSLLQALEDAPQQPAMVAPTAETQVLLSLPSSQRRQRTGASRAASRHQLLGGVAAGLGPGADAWGGSTGSAASSAASLRVAKRSDSRSRMAWSTNHDGAAPAAEAAPGSPLSWGQATQAAAAPIRFSRQSLPPLGHPLSAAVSLPLVAAQLLEPDAQRVGSPAASPPSSKVRRISGAAALGPGNSDPVTWSGVAAALADVIMAVQREFGGANELYNGMHLAGPEGSTAADLAAAAAVCPRSGACIAAVVNVRRLTDAGALYDAALAARRATVGPAHPTLIDLQLQYARHLSAAGEHSRAEAVCRGALAQVASPQFGSLGCNAAAAEGCGVHPVEVDAMQQLGAVLLGAGSLPAATTVLSSAVAVSERLAAAGDMAAADARRVKALDGLADVLWQRAMAAQEGGEAQGGPAAAAAAAAGRSHMTRAVEYKRQAIELTLEGCGGTHERVMRGWVSLGHMLEAAGDLAGAEQALESAAEVALHRHSRLSAATKAIFRQLQRVYQAQGRTADAEVLGHMYRLKGGLLSQQA